MYHETSDEVEDYFSTRVKHNFKTQVLLCLKGKNWTREGILIAIYNLPGYKCHKVAKYGYKWSHIHIKFEEEAYAQAAIVELESVISDLGAVLVDDMLREWHNFEMKFGYGPSWTMTVVDTIGSTPRCLNFLTENILNYLFQDFGNPYLLPYTAALNERHVQMAFHSMTEALAACMAFGQWYRMNTKLDLFCYRVRINPAHREAFLIKNCGGNPDEAFMLDYFVNVRNESTLNLEANGWDNNQNDKNCSGYSPSHGENNKEMFRQSGMKEFRTNEWSLKQSCQDGSENNLARRLHQTSLEHQSRENIQSKHCTPLVCVPVIAPINSSYGQTLVSSGQISTDIKNALMKFPKSYAEVLESHSAAARDKVPINASSLEKTSLGEITSGNEASKPLRPFENNSSRVNDAPCVDRTLAKYKNKLKKQTNKRSVRVFERRDASFV